MPITVDGTSEGLAIWEEPDLSLLAAQAAMELDEIIRGKVSDLKSVRQLAEAISDKLQSSGEPVSMATLRDPRAALVVQRAISAAIQQDSQPTTVSQLIQEARSVAQRLSSIDAEPKQQGTDSLAEMKAFCIALSKSAATKRRLPDWNNRHSYRK